MNWAQRCLQIAFVTIHQSGQFVGGKVSMRRDGYIVVSADHRLFPNSVAKAIEARIQAILTEIERSHSLTLTPLAFEIHQQPRAGRTAAGYVRALFNGNDNSRVRLIVSSDPIAPETLRLPFQNTDLLVTIEDTGAAFTTLRKGQIGPRSANMTVANSKIERAIEDIILDIAMGTYFRERPPLSDLVLQEGLDSLFRAKARFFKSNIVDSWCSQMEHDATYAPLSSLNQLLDDDVEGRAASAFNTWLSFCRSLTASRLSSTDKAALPGDSKGSRRVDGEAEEPQSVASLAKLPKIGGQLPIRRIAAASTRLPEGQHTLIVLLKSSSARKSPSLRGKLTALFGVHARRNSFRILSNERYLATRHIVEDLSRSGHIMAVKLVLGDNDQGES